MAHTSFLFIALTAGYFVTLVYLMDRVKRSQYFTYGLLAYLSTVAMIAIGTIARSFIIELDRSAGAHLEIWISGLSWLACCASAACLLASFLPPVNLKDKTF